MPALCWEAGRGQGAQLPLFIPKGGSPTHVPALGEVGFPIHPKGKSLFPTQPLPIAFSPL